MTEFFKHIESYITKWNDYFEYIDKLLDKVIVSGDIFIAAMKRPIPPILPMVS